MRKVLLVILDGWGHSDFQGEPDTGNAVEQAEVPTFRRLYDECPRTRLACSGADVGLPDGQMGNSEVGHLNLGAGRTGPSRRASWPDGSTSTTSPTASGQPMRPCTSPGWSQTEGCIATSATSRPSSI